jgi:hypothetical protein
MASRFGCLPLRIAQRPMHPIRISTTMCAHEDYAELVKLLCWPWLPWLLWLPNMTWES